jgi:predicted peptidase
VKHLLSLPAGEGPHPLLCFLHGYDEGAPSTLERALKKHGPLAAGNLALVQERFVVIAPQLPLAGDYWHRYAEEVQSMVQTVLEDDAVDATRMYLTGFSFGGNGVFDIAALEPQWWQALWAVDPTRVPKADPERPVWLSAGPIARVRQSALIPALRLKRDQEAERVYDDQGDDHVGTARRAYADERIYSWLLRFRSAPVPVVA